jgi:hypothetical protein
MFPPKARKYCHWHQFKSSPRVPNVQVHWASLWPLHSASLLLSITHHLSLKLVCLPTIADVVALQALSMTALLQITIARACQVAFTGLFCLFIVIGLFPICLLRATMGPGVGIFSNLGFGITIIQGQFSWAPHHGYQLLWKDVRPESCPFCLIMFSIEAACS